MHANQREIDLFPRPAAAWRGLGKGVPPLPAPLLHKCVEEREIYELFKK